MKTVRFECGTEHKNVSPYYWQVLQAINTPHNWQPSTDAFCFLVFTSQHAVTSFFSNPLNLNLINKCKEARFAAVGPQTAALISSQSGVANLQVYCTAGESVGLAPLLNTLREGHSSQDKRAIVFTGSEGNSEAIVAEFLREHPNVFLSLDVVKTYDLVPAGEGLPEQVRTAMEKVTVGEEIVFSCRSGRILKEVVYSLQCYYQLTNSADLPPFLKFEVWGASAEKALGILGIEHLRRDESE